jgi:hypothetical protein
MADNRTSIGTLASGESVFDRHHSHAESHGVSRELLAEALSRITGGGQGFFVQQVDFDRVIGMCQCVRTTRDDDVIYAARSNRGGLSRFVKLRQPNPSRSLIVVLKRSQPQDGDYYVIISAYIGERAPPEPWDEVALDSSGVTLQQSLHFWDRHALIWRSERFKPDTITLKYPWRELHARVRNTNATTN